MSNSEAESRTLIKLEEAELWEEVVELEKSLNGEKLQNEIASTFVVKIENLSASDSKYDITLAKDIATDKIQNRDDKGPLKPNEMLNFDAWVSLEQLDESLFRPVSQSEIDNDTRIREPAHCKNEQSSRIKGLFVKCAKCTKSIISDYAKMESHAMYHLKKDCARKFYTCLHCPKKYLMRNHIYDHIQSAHKKVVIRVNIDFNIVPGGNYNKTSLKNIWSECFPIPSEHCKTSAITPKQRRKKYKRKRIIACEKLNFPIIAEAESNADQPATPFVTIRDYGTSTTENVNQLYLDPNQCWLSVSPPRTKRHVLCNKCYESVKNSPQTQKLHCMKHLAAEKKLLTYFCRICPMKCATYDEVTSHLLSNHNIQSVYRVNYERHADYKYNDEVQKMAIKCFHHVLKMPHWNVDVTCDNNAGSWEVADKKCIERDGTQRTNVEHDKTVSLLKCLLCSQYKCKDLNTMKDHLHSKHQNIVTATVLKNYVIIEHDGTQPTQVAEPTATSSGTYRIIGK